MEFRATYQKLPTSQAYSEENISQKPAVEVLKKLGYIELSPNEAEEMRGSLNNVLLKSILQKQLQKINSFEYKDIKHKFSSKNIKQAMLDLDHSLTNGLVKTNEQIYDYLMLGKSYTQQLEDGTKRSFNLNYIDWDNLENNVFHVVEEFSVERELVGKNARPDIVLFVNGIPFAVIECKKSSISIEQGISQMIRNQGKDYIPQLFKFVQIVMSTNKNQTKYATTSTPAKFWAVWKEQDEQWHQQQLSSLITHRKPTIQDENIISLFHPTRVFELIKYFIVFDKDAKIITRYQQFFAIKETIKTIEERDELGRRQSGVIWHTQGSGKSLTMAMFAKYILFELSKHHPKVIIVTDRKNLDKQIHSTFNHTRLKASRATSGKNLISLIKDENADIVTTVINKFEKATKKEIKDESKDIFVLIDESHRTQYGSFHIYMKNIFPNACYLGFTGTPLLKKEKNTLIKFGKLIHQYTIVDGVNDKAIVPLLYEGRMIEQTINQKAIDTRLDMITRNFDDSKKEQIKKKWSNFTKIASSVQRIKLIAFDINQHFLHNYKLQGTQFKAMLATNSKIEAIRYLEAFEELGDLNAKVIISGVDDREEHEEVDVKSKNIIKQFWDSMMKKYGDEDKYEDSIKDDFVNGDSVDLLIVVDKLLTGFDAPRATVLYIDKEMREHTLLQAIARVNRLYEGKDYGFIIDYRGLLQKLDEAMDMYSGSGLENFDAADIKGAVYDVISIVGSIRSCYTNLINLFVSVKNKDNPLEYEDKLENEELRDLFYSYLSEFGKNLAIAFESETIYNALDKGELDKYKQALKFFQELRKSAKTRYSDEIDNKAYEPQMQNLMDTYIVAEEVIPITKPVDILDKKNFVKELERLGSKRAKADAIRTRITKSISEKWDENPVFFKKFSKMVQEVLSNYKEQRISESEYFNEMESIMKKYQQGDSQEQYPKNIKHNSDAKAYYGVIQETIEQLNPNLNIDLETYGKVALEIQNIINKHIKVDFKDNIDIHNKIAQDIEDLLFELKKELNLVLEFDDIDTIIETVRTISIRKNQ